MNKLSITALVLGLSGASALSQQVSPPEKGSYSIRGSFKVLDKEGSSVNHLVAGKSYTLEVLAETHSSMIQAITGVDWLNSVPSEIVQKRVPFEGENYGEDDFFYGFVMSLRSNYVRSNGLNSRSTINTLPRQGISNAKSGVIGRYSLDFSDASSVTNASVRRISFDTFDAFEDGGNKKTVKTRSLPIAIMPADYSGVILRTGINDGEVPANDVKKDGRGWNIINGQKIGYEPFYAVGAKASGNFVLQRSVGDASGPYTIVQTISPGTAGSFNDREAYTNNWKNVFYRLVPENRVQPASSGKPVLLENKVGL